MGQSARQRASRILAVAAALVLPFVPAAGGAQPEGPARPSGVTVRLSTDRNSYQEGEPIVVRVTIANSGPGPAEILRWFTPVDGVERSLFTVLRDGQPVHYRGKMAKRAAPTQRDYLTLAAGDEIGTEVDLSVVYDVSRPGRYEIVYDVGSIQLYPGPLDESSRESRLTSAPLVIVVGGAGAVTGGGSAGVSSSLEAKRTGEPEGG